MSEKVLEEELKERLHTRRLDRLVASMSGACISNARCYSIDNDQRIFVKTNGSTHARTMFDGELESLKQMAATKTIRVPKPIAVMHNFDGKSSSALTTEFLDMSPLTRETAISLGQRLAELHSYNSKVIKFNERASRWVGKQIPSVKHSATTTTTTTASAEDHHSDEHNEEEEEEENSFSKHSMRLRAGQREQTDAKSNQIEATERFVPHPATEQVDEFGFHVPTSCGSIPQLNSWSRDWVSFYARQRLDHAIRMILSDHGDRELNEQWSHLQLKIANFFSDFQHKGSAQGEIVPALLHGDLWSGNAAQLADGSCPVVYDPASFYGHAEYEFGIARMFGAFPAELERSYFELLPRKPLFEKRNKLYQLFHHLNHWNHFGSGYRSSSLKIMKDLTAQRL